MIWKDRWNIYISSSKKEILNKYYNIGIRLNYFQSVPAFLQFCSGEGDILYIPLYCILHIGKQLRKILLFYNYSLLEGLRETYLMIIMSVLSGDQSGPGAGARPGSCSDWLTQSRPVWTDGDGSGPSIRALLLLLEMAALSLSRLRMLLRLGLTLSNTGALSKHQHNEKWLFRERIVLRSCLLNNCGIKCGV